MANRNGSKDKQEQLTDDRFTSERLHSRCYYCVINFQCPHRKTKTADGRMRHPEVHRDWLSNHTSARLSGFSIGQVDKIQEWFLANSYQSTERLV